VLRRCLSAVRGSLFPHDLIWPVAALDFLCFRIAQEGITLEKCRALSGRPSAACRSTVLRLAPPSPAVIGCVWETDDLADSLLIDEFSRLTWRNAYLNQA
jgi:hypothetical protein